MKKFKLVCIVDDDPVYVFGARKIMERANFAEEFSVFHNPEIALNNLSIALETNTQLPDVMLMDINMPMLDGWQLLEELSKFPALKNIAVYVMSSSIEPDDVQQAKRFPIVKGYLNKPLNNGVLEKLCSAATDGKFDNLTD